MDPEVAPSGSTGQDLTIVPSGITSYSHPAVRPYPPVPSPASLHWASILLFLFSIFLALFSGTWGL